MADKPVNIDLRAKDNASRAMQAVSDRLLELQRDMDALRAKGNVNLTVADAGNLSRMEREAKRLSVALQEVETTGKKTATGISGAFGNLQGQLSQIGLGGLGGVLSVAGAAGAAVGLGKLAVNLATVGEESAQLEARFNAFAGGAQKGAANIQLMNDAVGIALSRDNQMIAMNALMASGLTETAAQAANVAQAAVWLGNASQAPIQRIEALTNALLSGRTKGLVPYGIDMDALKGRVTELQAANGGLSTSQATLNAFMEQAGPLMRRVQEEGGLAVTSVQELAVAWEDLKDEMGTVIAPVIAPQIAQLAENIRQIMAVGKTDPMTMMKRTNDYNDAGARRVQAEEQLAKAQRSGYGVEAASEALAAAQANEQVATSALNAALAAKQLGNKYGETGALANALAGSQKELSGANYDLATSFDAITAGIGTAGNQMAAFDKLRMAEVFRKNEADTDWLTNRAGLRPPGSDYEDTEAVYKNIDENAARYQKQEATTKRDAELEAIRNTKTAWTGAASDVASAWKDGISGITGELRSGMNVSKGLADYTKVDGGGGAEDANGWMKDIRRLQAWISDGSWGETAQKFGITDKGDAKERIRKFQTGQWDASVTALIDKDALAKQIEAQGAGSAFLDAFAADVAKASGDNPAVVKAMLGFQGDKNGKGAMDMKPMAQAVSSSFNAEVTTQSAEFVKAGNTLFSYVGQGFIDSAKSSGLLLQAVQQMVYSLLPKK